MSRRQEFDIPDLGPADGGRHDAASAPVAVSAGASRGGAAKPGSARGSNLLHSLVLVLLTAAASGLGYWGYGLHQQLETSLAQQAQMSQRLGDLELLLEVASDSASQSGQSLSGRLEQQGKAAEEKYQLFDSEIAKLWTIAYQSNKPKIEAQEKRLATQAEQLATQAQQLSAQTGHIEAQNAQLARLSTHISTQDSQLQAFSAEIKSLQAGLSEYARTLTAVGGKVDAVAGLEKSQAGFRGDFEKTVADLKRSLATLETQVRISEEIQSEKVAAQQSAVRTLGEQVDALQASAGSADIGRRVRVNEQAIQAIDGNRRQLNQDLLQLRQQLNDLKLRLR